MQQLKLGVILVGLCLLAGLRAEEDNPFKKAKVGDWVSYTMKVEMPGTVIEAEMKQIVTAKTEKEVTFESITTREGQESKSPSITVKLDQKFDPLQLPEGAKLKEIAKGDEKITAGGKTFDTQWQQVEVTTKNGDQDVTTKAKIWLSATVPLTTIVKITTDGGDQGKLTMELKDFGSK